MSQTFTDNCFASGNIALTDLQNMENNFAALKSSFSGALAPSNTIAGMFWYDTTANILKQRNELDTAWISIWDLANNKPIITNLSNEITGAMIAAAIKDAAGGTPSLRTLGTAATAACAGNDARLFDARPIPNASISQSKLKTSMGEVSIAVSSSSAGETVTNAANLTLPGGEYGFYPQEKRTFTGDGTGSAHASLCSGIASETYTTYIYLTAFLAVVWGSCTCTAYAQQRYVTSSGEVFWIFILRDKITKKIISMYAAPDHPCFGNGGEPLLVSHPFPDFKSETQEIIVINPSKEQVAEMETMQDVDADDKPDLSFLEVMEKFYEIDENSNPKWPTEAVTVGLPKGHDWRNMTGKDVKPIKKVIPRPEGILVKSLKLK